tara:strand:+ start:23331 stop:23591 length:261 start_codon:yes stop_codon:yes gene_type:complete
MNRIFNFDETTKEDDDETTEGELIFSHPLEAYNFRTAVKRAKEKDEELMEWQGQKLHTKFAEYLCELLVQEGLLLDEDKLNNPTNN